MNELVSTFYQLRGLRRARTRLLENIKVETLRSNNSLVGILNRRVLQISQKIEDLETQLRRKEQS